MVEIQESKINRDLDFKNISKVFKHVGSFIVNLGVVFYLEYTITASFADRANILGNYKNEKMEIGFLENNAFAILQFTY